MGELILCSVCILNGEWVQVGSPIRINIGVEFIPVAASAARTILHLDEVQRTSDRSVHVLQLPLLVLLLPLSYLLLPNLSVVDLGIFLRLGPHRQVVLVVIYLGVELRLFNVSLVFELVYLLE